MPQAPDYIAAMNKPDEAELIDLFCILRVDRQPEKEECVRLLQSHRDKLIRHRANDHKAHLHVQNAAKGINSREDLIGRLDRMIVVLTA